MNIYVNFLFSFAGCEVVFSNSDGFGLWGLNMRDPVRRAVVLKRLSLPRAALSLITMRQHSVNKNSEIENVTQIAWLYRMQQVQQGQMWLYHD